MTFEGQRPCQSRSVASRAWGCGVEDSDYPLARPAEGRRNQICRLSWKIRPEHSNPLLKLRYSTSPELIQERLNHDFGVRAITSSWRIRGVAQRSAELVRETEFVSATRDGVQHVDVESFELCAQHGPTNCLSSTEHLHAVLGGEALTGNL